MVDDKEKELFDKIYEKDHNAKNVFVMIYVCFYY